MYGADGFPPIRDQFLFSITTMKTVLSDRCPGASGTSVPLPCTHVSSRPRPPEHAEASASAAASAIHRMRPPMLRSSKSTLQRDTFNLLRA